MLKINILDAYSLNAPGNWMLQLDTVKPSPQLSGNKKLVHAVQATTSINWKKSLTLR